MRRLLVPALMLTACTTLSAHDFWLASPATAGARIVLGHAGLSDDRI